MATFRVEKTKDYTVMSNHHLRDSNLSLKAKGMLSLMLSLPDDWDYTLAGLAYICKDGIASIRTTVTELEERGYLSRCRLRNGKGQLGDTEYTIYEKPQKLNIGVKSSAPACEKPICGKQTLDEPTLVKPTCENDTQYNTDTESTQALTTDESNTYQSIAPAVESYSQLQPSYPQASANDTIDEIDSYQKYREIVYGNIEYEILCERYERATLDEIVETMLDYICGKRDSVRIGKAEYPAEIVKSRLLKLDSSHIEYICHCIKRNTTKVKNIRAYLLATLYNAPTTMEHYYTTLVAHDMANMKQ